MTLDLKLPLRQHIFFSRFLHFRSLPYSPFAHLCFVILIPDSKPNLGTHLECTCRGRHPSPGLSRQRDLIDGRIYCSNRSVPWRFRFVLIIFFVFLFQFSSNLSFLKCFLQIGTRIDELESAEATTTTLPRVSLQSNSLNHSA